MPLMSVTLKARETTRYTEMDKTQNHHHTTASIPFNTEINLVEIMLKSETFADFLRRARSERAWIIGRFGIPGFSC